MEVKIIRSSRRRKTVSARLVNDVLLINAPCHISDTHLEKIVGRLKERLQHKKLKEELDKNEDLMAVFNRLNEKYFEDKLKVKAIEYVTNHNSRFGCCNYGSAHIRISHRLSIMPVWVRDYVIVHEMAHLLEPNHGKEFWAMARRYELAERARGYLMAVGLEQEEDESCEAEPPLTRLGLASKPTCQISA